MAVITETIDFEVSLEDFDDWDLVEELERRGFYVSEMATDCSPEDVSEMLNRIYTKRKLQQDVTQELDSLLYSVLGKII